MERLDGYAREVHQFVARRVSNRMDAEDIAQQSLLKACQKLGACRGDNLRAWLLTIARHLIVDHFRSQRRFEFVEAEEAARSEREMALQSAPDAVPEVCANRERLRCYFECISNRLRLEEQIAVLLADVHGYRDKDAAAEMGVSLPSLKLLLHGARARLHECAWGRCALVRKGPSTVNHGAHPDGDDRSRRNGNPVNGGYNSPATERNGRASRPPVDDRPEGFANRHCPGRVAGPLCAAGSNGHGHDSASCGDAVSRPGFGGFCPKAAGGSSKECCLGVSCRLGLRCSRVVPKLVALRDRLLAALGGGALLRAAEVSSCPVNELTALWRNAETAAQWVVMV